MKLRNNQSGIAHVAAILVVVVLAIIGVVGWKVWKNNDDKKSNSSSSNQTVSSASNSKTKSTQATDPSAKWKAYSTKDTKLSLKYPETWVAAANPNTCTDGLYLLGANSSSVGECGTNNFGQITIASRQNQICGDLSSESWNVTAKEDITVDKVAGIKQTATSKTSNSTIITQYCFKPSDTAYILSYTKTPTYPDVLSDFNTVVTKTVSFN